MEIDELKERIKDMEDQSTSEHVCDWPQECPCGGS